MSIRRNGQFQVGLLTGVFGAVLFLILNPMTKGQQKWNGLEALQPGFFQLIGKNAVIEELPIEFRAGKATRVSFGTFQHFTEGPVWNPRGFLLFSDIYGDAIYEWTPGGKGEIFLDHAGYPNGLTFDQQGRLIICNQKLRRLERLESNGNITVLAAEWHGKKLNCPNDVVVRKDGTIYFTDPYWKFPPGAVQELSFQAVWRISPNGKLAIAAKDFRLPNGIGFSPDEKTLYVDDTVRRNIYVFDVNPDGSLSNERLFASLQSKEKGAVDGMKVDERGDIFSTGPGGIWVFDKHGTHLGTIRPPAIPANCAWGGSDYRTLYLMTPHAVYRIHTRVRGMITYPTKAKEISDYPAFRKTG